MLQDKKGEKIMVYAVIDTNIFVSAFITKNVAAATRKLLAI